MMAPANRTNNSVHETRRRKRHTKRRTPRPSPRRLKLEPLETRRMLALGSAWYEPGISAKHILESGASVGDGVYWIDPDGPGGNPAFEAYCDMTTDGGGWTLAVNGVLGEEPESNDMVFNSGRVGLETAHTRDLTALAIDSTAQIRHEIDASNMGAGVYDGAYEGRYHGVLPNDQASWTLYAPPDWTLIRPDLPRSWSNNLNGEWYYYGQFPGQYPSIPSAPSNGFSQGPAIYSDANRAALSYRIWVRELVTPEYVPQIMGTSPDLEAGSALEGMRSVSIFFSEPAVGGGSSANLELVDLGPDVIYGTADDTVLPIEATYEYNRTTLIFSALPIGSYRLIVRDSITNTSGIPFDGDGDGVAGGDYVCDFTTHTLRMGERSDFPGVSAKHILDSGASVGDGVYWIDPDGPGGNPVFQAYCDMTTDGGGWTLAVNSVLGREPDSNDMVFNPGTGRLDTPYNADLTALAIDSTAQIRHEIDASNVGAGVFDGAYEGRYHGSLPNDQPSWTLYVPSDWTLMRPDLPRSWSNNSEGSWYYYDQSPGQYPSIPSAWSNGLSQGPAIYSDANRAALSYRIWVRELVTPEYLPHVMDTSPDLEGGSVLEGLTDVVIHFNESILGGDDLANLELTDLGPDAIYGTADDTALTVRAFSSRDMTHLTFSALPIGNYRLVIRDSITNTAGIALDGDRNGVAGGDYVRDFTARAVRLGERADFPGISAKHILESGASVGDGVYWIDPDGPGGDPPFQAYCDMTTDGGGWTLTVNSVLGQEPESNDMVSNTGAATLYAAHTRDLAPLAIDSTAQIRHEIDASNVGAGVFDGAYEGTYHGVLPRDQGGWTLYTPSDWTLMRPDLPRSWSSGLNGSWYYYSQFPGQYPSIPSALSNGPAQGPTLYSDANRACLSYRIWVRELVTPTFNEPPVGLDFTVSRLEENQQLETVVGQFTVSDPDLPNDSHTYGLVAGEGDTDNPHFTIHGDQLFASSSFDFETRSTYNIRVRCTDAAGAYIERSFSLQVLDLPETMVVGPEDWPASGAVMLTVVDGKLHAFETGTMNDIVAPHAVGNATDVVVQGRDLEDDHLTVDYSGGNLATGGVAFDGGASSNDAMSLSGAIVDTVTTTSQGGGSGSIQLGSASLTAANTYSGLETLSDELIAANRTIVFSNNGETITLSDDGIANNDRNSVQSSLSERIDFVNPTEKLLLDASHGDDHFVVGNLDTRFSADLWIYGPWDSDSIELNGDIDLFGELFVAVTGTLTLNGSIATHDRNVYFVTNNAQSVWGDIDTGDASIYLTSDGPVTQTTGAIVASELQLGGGGTFTLQNAGNDVDALTGSLEGDLYFKDADDLTIGIAASRGLQSTGVVRIDTVNGSITVANDVSADSVTVIQGGETSLLHLNTGTNISGATSIALKANNMNLEGDATAPTISLWTTMTGQDIDLGAEGDTLAGVLQLSADELNRMNATDTLRIIGGSYGDLAITAPLSPASAASLRLVAGNQMTQTAPITVQNLAIIASGGAHLGAFNDVDAFSAVSSSGGAINFTDVDGFSVGVADEINGISNGGGFVTLQSYTGDIVIEDTSAANDIVARGLALCVYQDEGAVIVASGARLVAETSIDARSDEVDLQGEMDAPAVTIVPHHSGEAIDLGSTGDDALNTLELSDAELDRITAGTLKIGQPGSGTFTISAPLSLTTVDTLRLSTGGDVTELAGISVANLGVRTDSGNVSLDGVNEVDVVAINAAGLVSFNELDGYTVGCIAEFCGIISGTSGVSLEAQSGNIAIAENVSATSLLGIELQGDEALLTILPGADVGITHGPLHFMADKMDLLGTPVKLSVTAAKIPEKTRGFERLDRRRPTDPFLCEPEKRNTNLGFRRSRAANSVYV